jgi:hypothetical protein
MMCKNERGFQKYPLKDYSSLSLPLKKTSNMKKQLKKAFEWRAKKYCKKAQMA